MTTAHAEREGVETIVKASWYGKWHHGKLMANGKPFNMFDPTIVAHRSLPLGTVLKVKNPLNGKARIAVVQDRGPYIHGRSLDVSYALASALEYVEEGVTVLQVTILKLG